MHPTIEVYEHFVSISGEIGSVPAGTPMLFIRLAGCNLRCSYCDTPETQVAVGRHFGYVELKKLILSSHMTHVMFTGGEPLLQQENLLSLLVRFKEDCDKCVFHIETNGTIVPLMSLAYRATLVIDYKISYAAVMAIPFSEYSKMPSVFVKFVIGNEVEFYSAVFTIQKIYETLGGEYKPWFAIGTYNHELMPESKLAQMIIDSQVIRTSLNYQLHKKIGVS